MKDNTNRRRRIRLKPAVESLDPRINPSTIGVGLGERLAAARAARLAALQASRANALLGANRPAPPRLNILPPSRPALPAARPLPNPTASFVQFRGGTQRPLILPARGAAIRPPAAIPDTLSPGSGSPPVTNAQGPATTTNAIPKADSNLNRLYDEYRAFQDTQEIEFVSDLAPVLQIRGTSVGVNIRVSGDVSQAATELSGLGVQIRSIEPNFRIIEGHVPIGQLASVGQLTSVIGIDAVYAPITRRGPGR